MTLFKFVGNGKYDPEQKLTYQFTSMAPSSSSKVLQGSSRHNTNLHHMGMHTMTIVLYTLPCTCLCTETLYEKDGTNSITSLMQARQSTQPTHNHHGKQVAHFDNIRVVSTPVVNIPVLTKKKPSGVTENAIVPSRCGVSCCF